MTTIVQFMADQFYWVFLGILLLNVFQRRHHETAQKKRFATLYLGSAAFVVFLVANAVVQYGLPEYSLIIGVVVVIGVLYLLREHTFPFRLHCRRSGKRLDMHTILFRDSNILPEFDEEVTADSPRAADEVNDQQNESEEHE